MIPRAPKRSKRSKPPPKARKAKAAAASPRSWKRKAELAEAKLRTALATYKMAEVNRFTKDWKRRRRNADLTIVPDAPITQARARQLVRDDAYCASAVRAFVRNVVGRGVQITPTRKLDDGTPDTAWKAAASAYWDEWASDPKRCDVEGRRTFTMILEWCVREYTTVGEGLLHRVESANGVMFQTMEADDLNMQLESFEFDGPGGEKLSRRVVGGVEIDENNAAVAYHFASSEQETLPNEQPWKQRIPAERIIHFFDPERACQTRGITKFAPVGLRARNLSEYDSNQLLAARAEACIGFITKLAQSNAPFGTTDEEETSSESSSESETTTTTPEVSDLSPLMLARLTEGEDVVPFTPSRPGDLYEPFTKAQLRAIAAGLGISYELIARDFTGGTYSSQRQGMLEDRREFRRIQDMLIALVVRPVRRSVIEWGILHGGLSAPGYTLAPASWLAARFMPDGWQWIDPEKEANGAKLAIEAGLSTREIECGKQALDWEAITEQNGIENDTREAKGLVDSDAPFAPTAQNPVPQAPALPPATGAGVSAADLIGALLSAPAVRTLLSAAGRALERRNDSQAGSAMAQARDLIRLIDGGESRNAA